LLTRQGIPRIRRPISPNSWWFLWRGKLPFYRGGCSRSEVRLKVRNRGAHEGTNYFTARLTKVQPDTSSSRDMSRRRRSTWRLSAGGGLRLWRRSPVRRSRTTSSVWSANACLRRRYRWGLVRDTMKRKSPITALDGFAHDLLGPCECRPSYLLPYCRRSVSKTRRRFPNFFTRSPVVGGSAATHRGPMRAEEEVRPTSRRVRASRHARTPPSSSNSHAMKQRGWRWYLCNSASSPREAAGVSLSALNSASSSI